MHFIGRDEYGEDHYIPNDGDPLYHYADEDCPCGPELVPDLDLDGEVWEYWWEHYRV